MKQDYVQKQTRKFLKRVTSDELQTFVTTLKDEVRLAESGDYTAQSKGFGFSGEGVLTPADIHLLNLTMIVVEQLEVEIARRNGIK